MKLLFNKEDNGQAEIKELLGFLDADFEHKNLLPDIDLNTPDLVHFISQAVYDMLVAYYEARTEIGEANEDDAIKYAQLYIASMAYLDFAPNHDLTHGNDGRNARSENNEKTPWDWQIERDNAALRKRAYKALDRLMVVLDGSGWTEWTESDAYIKANSLLLHNTQAFDDVLPIHKSGCLYYRMVTFMEDFEEQEICSILGKDTYLRLQAGTGLNEDEKHLLKQAQKAIAYNSIARAYKTFPIEMFNENLTSRNQNTERQNLVDRKYAFFTAQSDIYLKKLESKVTALETTETECIEQDPAAHIEGEKHVNL